VEVDPIRSGLDAPLAQSGTTTSYPYLSGDDCWGVLPRELSTVSPVEMWFSPLPPLPQDLLREQALRLLEGDIGSDAAANSFYDAVESDQSNSRVFSPARVATWCALEVPWGHVSPLIVKYTMERDRLCTRSGPFL
jgi:hypothetical protein